MRTCEHCGSTHYVRTRYLKGEGADWSPINLCEGCFIKVKSEGCETCGGAGYVEYETGVVSPSAPYVREIAKDVCECYFKEA